MAAFEIKRRGLMLVLSSPSGAGKTTISREILARDGNIAMSVSARTRPRSPAGSAAGDNHFCTRATFAMRSNNHKLLQPATSLTHHTATPRTPGRKTYSAGADGPIDR